MRRDCKQTECGNLMFRLCTLCVTAIWHLLLFIYHKQSIRLLSSNGGVKSHKSYECAHQFSDVPDGPLSVMAGLY